MSDQRFDTWSTDQLRELNHGDPEGSFAEYLDDAAFPRDRHRFLTEWIAPEPSDFIVEYGCASGKTCMDLAQQSGCIAHGIDFDEGAIEFARECLARHFPELSGCCSFQTDDVTTNRLDPRTTKIVLADFTEHIPDPVFDLVLENVAAQLPEVTVYIYTPDRNHLFEQLKARNLILKNASGHINVKRNVEVVTFLRERGWQICENRWRPSHFGGFRFVEFILGHTPLVGKFFHRRIAIKATPPPSP